MPFGYALFELLIEGTCSRDSSKNLIKSFTDLSCFLNLFLH